MGIRIGPRSKIAVFLVAALMGAFLVVEPSWGFHDGGVAPCDGCHSMHATNQGLPSGPRAFLLQAASPTSICLNCHEGQIPSENMVSTSGALLGAGLPPNMLTPGGDFGWLKKRYSWVDNLGMKQEPGDRHGHNIVAPDYGYFADATRAVAPGGTYPAQRLHCTSCHDPHGRYRVVADGTIQTTGLPIAGSGSVSVGGGASNPVAGRSAVGSYRLLAGVGYRTSSDPSHVFTDAPPAAVAPASCNRSEASTQTRVAYGSNVSAWCGNCHSPGVSGGFVHHNLGYITPRLTAAIADQYNKYVKTGDLSGSSDTSFSSLIPFQMELTNSTTDRNAMAAVACSDGSCLRGPGSVETVSCLTCHRAHASGWRAILRWNPDAALIVYGGVYPGINTGAPPGYHMGRTEVETRRAYYDRPATIFAANQNRLCEKCHAGYAP